ncbi:hypothetical protein QTP70_014345, partial [Hemibagrus guttatus]
GSFCFNYCLNWAWHGGDQFVALLRWYVSPGFFDSGLQLICIFWSLVSHFPLDNTPQILYGLQVCPGKTPLTLSVVQEWLNKRNTTTVDKFLDTSVCGGS